MRPRVFPAEDSVLPTRTGPGGSRFNEAAGIPRGRLRKGRRSAGKSSSFNEAAGIPRGRPAS